MVPNTTCASIFQSFSRPSLFTLVAYDDHLGPHIKFIHKISATHLALKLSGTAKSVQLYQWQMQQKWRFSAKKDFIHTFFVWQIHASMMCNSHQIPKLVVVPFIHIAWHGSLNTHNMFPAKTQFPFENCTCKFLHWKLCPIKQWLILWPLLWPKRWNYNRKWRCKWISSVHNYSLQSIYKYNGAFITVKKISIKYRSQEVIRISSIQKLIKCSSDFFFLFNRFNKFSKIGRTQKQ